MAFIVVFFLKKEIILSLFIYVSPSNIITYSLFLFNIYYDKMELVINMDIIIASNNQNKIREFKKIFENTDINLYSLRDKGIDIDIVEDGKTFEENAYIKAKTIAQMTGLLAIADDSGLMCEALNGEPGIYSARYAGDMHDDEMNNSLLLKNIKNKENRNAKYVCAICLCKPNLEHITTKGECHGLIIDERRGDNGFGYDPYFFVPKFSRTMAEISLDEKNTISHRAKALNLLKGKYEKFINNK